MRQKSPLERADKINVAPKSVRHVAKPSVLRWVIPLLWIAIILALGTSYFSYARTKPLIEPFLYWLMPGADADRLWYWHSVIRWSAHFAVYATLFLVLITGPSRGRPLMVLLICAVCAMADEGLQ